jgi:hypothetical protein
VAKINYTVNNFLGGEISPRTLGRSDLKEYQYSCKTLKNFIVKPYGGVVKRSGTQYVINSNSNNKARLIPYIESDTSAMVVELTDGQIRIIEDTAGNLATIDTGSGARTFAAAEIESVQYVQSASVLFMVQKNNQPIMVLPSGSTYDSKYYVGYQFADTPNYTTTPYRDSALNTPATLTPGAISGNTTLTSNVVGFFDANHVGAYFRGNSGACVVTGYNSGTEVDVTVVDTFADTSAISSDDWQESSWSDYRGWPRSITIFQGRLCFGGNLSEPDTVWFSDSTNYFKMSLELTESLTANSPIQYTIASRAVNQIQWMSGGGVLSIGTLGDEYTVDSISATAAPSFKRSTSYGSRHVQAAQVANRLHFTDASGRNIREFVFDFESDSFRAQNLSLIAEHMFDKFKRENLNRD